MISSSSQTAARALDANVLIYSVLQNHPAALPCEQFIRSHPSWLTSPLVLLEAHATLTKVYNVAPAAATLKIEQAAGSLVVRELAKDAVLSAMHLAGQHGVDLTDAVLVLLAQQEGASALATDDQRLAQLCLQMGINAESPIDPAIRQQVAIWEAANLQPKGLPRTLRRVHDWLILRHPAAAPDFWSHSAACSRLP